MKDLHDLEHQDKVLKENYKERFCTWFQILLDKNVESTFSDKMHKYHYWNRAIGLLRILNERHITNLVSFSH